MAGSGRRLARQDEVHRRLSLIRETDPRTPALSLLALFRNLSPYFHNPTVTVGEVELGLVVRLAVLLRPFLPPSGGWRGGLSPSSSPFVAVFAKRSHSIENVDLLVEPGRHAHCRAGGGWTGDAEGGGPRWSRGAGRASATCRDSLTSTSMASSPKIKIPIRVRPSRLPYG
jgi:hypothetical protein